MNLFTPLRPSLNEPPNTLLSIASNIEMHFESAVASFSKSCNEFCLRQQHMLSLGWPADLVFGAYEVELGTIFGQENSYRYAATIPQWVANVVAPLEDVGIPEKLGLMLLFGRMMKVRSMK